MSAILPTEDMEQAVLVQHLRLRKLKHFRVPNETYTKSISQRAKNTRLGVVKGVPDIFVIVGDQLIAIEMKRRKGSATTPEQHEWIDALKNAGVAARICRGYDEAIEFIDAIERMQNARHDYRSGDDEDMWPERAA